jgi:hypothetical protein
MKKTIPLLADIRAFDQNTKIHTSKHIGSTILYWQDILFFPRLQKMNISNNALDNPHHYKFYKLIKRGEMWQSECRNHEEEKIISNLIKHCSKWADQLPSGWNEINDILHPYIMLITKVLGSKVHRITGIYDCNKKNQIRQAVS